MVNEVIRLANDSCEVTVWSLGAAVNDIRVPDRQGRLESVVLGYSSVGDRLEGRSYLGEVVGPVGNRIADARFSLDGAEFALERNDRGQSLHSGPDGFHRQTWQVLDQTPDRVRLTLTWADGRAGFPGPITVELEYRLEGLTLSHQLTARVGGPALVSPVAHPYFNLSGRLGSVLDHHLQIRAQSYLPVDDRLIPLASAPQPVADTAFDWRRSRLLSDLESATDPQVRACGGLDHAFVLDRQPTDPPSPAAVLYHSGSGRRLVIETDYPALQVYTGQGLDESEIAHPPGQPGPHCGVALETEGFPDAPNRPDFPSVVVRPGQTWRRTTRWVFSVD
ncbi:MAG: galactose mutarotase [Propionibacteriaceae bacterium]|jgi:aldose 1-epimerase|nr:galactose mutarotase [Propionibacteriaceae bacterium]